MTSGSLLYINLSFPKTSLLRYTCS